MKDFNEFGKILTEVKEYHKALKDDEFADKCGISRQAVDDIIKGITKNPRVSLLYNLQKNLNVNPAYFFGSNNMLMADAMEMEGLAEWKEKYDNLQRDFNKANQELLVFYREKRAKEEGGNEMKKGA